MTANVVLGVQRVFRGRRLITILLCTLVVLLVVVPLQLQHNVTNMLREKAVELGSEVHWPTNFPHFGAPPFEEQGMALDLEDAARRPPAAHEDPGRTTRCDPGRPVSDAKGVVRHVVQYALMLDAGSTGSRIHVYKFNYCAAKPELESEVFRHVEPGLSSYKADSRGAANSLRPLLDEAVKVIPEPLRRCSPVQLKATAGLRLLGGRQSQEIIRAVRELLEKEYPFPIADGVDASGRRNTRGVEIMEGREEGVFAWIAVNYLLNLIGSSGNLPSVEHKDPSGHVRKTAAVLDLGGGSTQIVFEPQMPPPHKAMQPGEHVYELHDFEGDSFTLYQNSYLGYGLKQARLAVNSISAFAHTLAHPETITQADDRVGKNVMPWGAMNPGNTRIPSPCYTEGMHKEVSIVQPEEKSEAKVTFVGTPGGFPACRRLVEVMMDKDAVCKQGPCSFAGVYQPSLKETFNQSAIIALSYFYDRIAPLGLGPTFTIGQLRRLAERVCASPSEWRKPGKPAFPPEAFQELEKRPDYCLDLTYMYVLFNLGYELGEARYVTLAKTIGNFELGWALGAQLAVLQQGAICK